MINPRHSGDAMATFSIKLALDPRWHVCCIFIRLILPILWRMMELIGLLGGISIRMGSVGRLTCRMKLGLGS